MEFWESMERKWPGIKRQRGPHYKHLSWNIYQDPDTGEIRKSQRDYLIEIVQAAGELKEHKLPSRSDLLVSDPDSPLLEQKASAHSDRLCRRSHTPEKAVPTSTLS